jgi:secreted Zn-dependent insulinase-like peptidase
LPLAGFRNTFTQREVDYVYVFQLSIGGYNSKQHVLLDKIMEKLTNFKIDPKRFEILKENVSIDGVFFYILLPILTRTNGK